MSLGPLSLFWDLGPLWYFSKLKKSVAALPVCSLDFWNVEVSIENSKFSPLVLERK